MIHLTLLNPRKKPNLNAEMNELYFNPDNCYLGKDFPNEFAAYQAKKAWTQILSHHFLIESPRDYLILISPITNFPSHILGCKFLSAVGRYSFWRLMNNQSQDAYNKLANPSAIRKSQL